MVQVILFSEDKLFHAFQDCNDFVCGPYAVAIKRSVSRFSVTRDNASGATSGQWNSLFQAEVLNGALSL